MRTHAPLAIALALLVTGRSGPWSLAPPVVGELVAREANDVCTMPADVQRRLFRAELQAQRGGRVVPPGDAPALTTPIRTIRDGYPTFAAVAVDVVRDEVILTDENLFQVLVYPRTEHTPAGVAASTPTRVIAGDHTNIEFQSGVALDPRTGDIYAANNDTRDTLVVFKQGSAGDATPIRQVRTPHGTFGVLIDDAHDELFMTEQHDSALVVYRKGATEHESPIRFLQGAKTGLQDPHGIAFDPAEDVLFVANYGSTHDVAFTKTPKTGVNQDDNRKGKTNWPLGREFAVPGSGTINPPSITVYARTAKGNAAPVRTIRGPNTGLNWPTGLAFDAGARELYVANDAAHEVLIFDARAKGDVKPVRVLKGPLTQLANPTGLTIDAKNRELWVANFGGHSATVYDLGAGGNVAPKRVLRNAPPGTPSLMIGNPGAVGYDSTRKEILVPNCVAHPQIAFFEGRADGQAERVRAIEGQRTMLGRTMHAIAYDEIHDEIYVTQQFGQGILVFRGAAKGDEPPLRVINGSKTMLIAPDRLAIDAVHDEIFVPEGVRLLVYSRTANGNVAPIRVITGPDTGIGATRAVAIDPVRNLIVAATQVWGGDEDDSSRSTTGSELRIFDRMANGNAKPLRVISGLRGMGNLAVDSPSGLIFSQQTRYIGVWRITDEGPVPPRFTIGGPNGVLRQGRGLALDPKNRAVIASDKALNAVLTFHVPELLREEPSQAGAGPQN